MRSSNKNPLQDTRKQALQLGNHYLLSLGYNGFSFQTIADELGIKKASLHYHFASKEDFGLALIAEHDRHFKIFTEKVQNLSSTQKLDRLIKIFSTIAKDNKKICPLGVFCTDFNTLSDGMCKSLAVFYKRQRKWLIETLRTGVKAREFKKNLDVDLAADLFMSTVQGGLQIARLHGGASAFRKNLKGLAKSFKSSP